MQDKVDEILDRLPPKPSRSRLDPHAALVEEMRHRGRTYREIAHVLAETCGVKTSPSNIYYFVQLRAREARQVKAQQPKREEVAPTVRNAPLHGNQRTDVAQRIAALKNRRLPEPTPTGFAYDPAEPLRLINPGEKKPDE